MVAGFSISLLIPTREGIYQATAGGLTNGANSILSNQDEDSDIRISASRLTIQNGAA